MFGYIRYEKPHLYFKDFALYQALYCGLCKGIAASSGHLSRFALTYDVTFFSLALHAIRGEDIIIEKQTCFEHPLVRRPIAKVDEMMKALGALNTILSYYKLTDDVQDKEKGKGARILVSAGYRKAKKEYPELEKIVREGIKAQAKTEKEQSASVDRAADATAEALQNLSDYFLKEKATEHTRRFFYAIGKWVYLIDALDDYEKDQKKGNYNPFLLSYGAKDKKELLAQNGEEVSFIFSSVLSTIGEERKNISFSFNTDLLDNILFRGIPMETKRVFQGEKVNKKESKSLTRSSL